MSSRRYERSEVTYDDRRDRDYASRGGGGSRYDDDSRYVEQEIEFRRSAPPVRERERERDREREEFEFREDRTRVRDPPAFLREDYGRTSAGPVVLRAREREEFDFVPRSRRRSPSPEIDKRTERESIIIRKDKEESESRPPPRRERSREREEIIIRRGERERAQPAPPPPPSPPPPQEEVQREEIIIRRQERSRSIPPARDEGETERIIIRRREDDDRASRYEPPPPRDFEREEIIIRRDRDRDEDARSFAPPPPAPSRRNIDYALVRPKSRERERSVAHDSDSEHEIIIRRDEIKDRGRSTEREEIIIRSRSHSSPSPAPSMRSMKSTKSTKSMKSTRSSRPAPPPEPQVVYAPQIHQEVITHHRHIDHGYEIAIPQRPRPLSRPPSPPSPPSPASLPSPSPPPPPPPAREQSEERIEIKRSGERNGRAYDEDIVIDRTEGARSVPPPAPPSIRYDPPAPRRETRYRDERDIEEEAEYYNQRALERSYPGEAWHGSTRDWAQVDVPPGTRRVRMDGAGGGAQEISWQRYNGMRRSKFYPEADEDEAYSNIDITREVTREVSRPAPPPPAPAPAPKPEPPPSSSSGDIGRRYGKTPDPKAGLWTEITKDLVIKEAITQMGYEYEETDEFYYIIAYLKYDDVARLVGLSEDIRKDRRRRVKEIEWETKIETEPPRRPLAIEPPAPMRSPRPPKYDREWEREEDRFIEREIIYRGNRPPPPPGRRR